MFIVQCFKNGGSRSKLTLDGCAIRLKCFLNICAISHWALSWVAFTGIQRVPCRAACSLQAELVCSVGALDRPHPLSSHQPEAMTATQPSPVSSLRPAVSHFWAFLPRQGGEGRGVSVHTAAPMPYSGQRGSLPPARSCSAAPLFAVLGTLAEEGRG